MKTKQVELELIKNLENLRTSYKSEVTIVRKKKLTKKQIKEAQAQEREEFLRNNRNGVFGSIY